jgi:hypothetical protein
MTPAHAEPAPAAATPANAPVMRRCGGTACPPGTCDHDGDLRRHAGGPGPATAPASVHQVLGTSGAPLDDGVRADLEPRFGHDFSQVRVHADTSAAASAQAVGAHAYTVGNHIAFAAGSYAPDTPDGRKLIAHELTHVVQQSGTPSAPAASLTVGSVDDPAEDEAERVATAVSEGHGAGPVGSAPARVSKQDDGGTPDAGVTTDAGAGSAAGGTPDAGPAPTGPSSGPGGTPDAGPDGGPPASGGPGPVGGGGAAPPPNLLRVEVENQREAITFPVPSNLGAAGRQHWVTIAGTRPDVTFRAVFDRAVAPGDPSVAGLTWESTPAGELAAGADALHTTTSVPTARKTVVRAVLGATRAEANLWAVFVAVRSNGTAMAAPVRAATRLELTGNASFVGTVHPRTIITDADHPALEGANTINPPGGTNICGNALAGGADHRWDMSRQRRLNNVGAPAVDAALMAQSATPCLYNESPYPAAQEEGNDDANPADETNDPYANGGTLTSTDNPTRFFFDVAGADGDTMERRLQFREFARLEFNNTWWKVSHFVPWRVHYRAIRTAGQWQDNGSVADDTNAGF